MNAYLLYRGQSAILPVETLLGTIPQLPRSVLSRLVTQMIDRLDEMDGDPDAEPDDEDRCGGGDDGCGVVWLNGRAHWGSDVEGEGDL